MLCDVCLDIFRGSCPAEFVENKHHGSIESLQRSILENCDICRLFWDDIPRILLGIHPLGAKDIKIRTVFSLTSYPVTSCPVNSSTQKLVFYRYLTSKVAAVPLAARYWNIYCEPTNDSNSSDAEKPYNYSDWTASMTCARTWLAECMKNHSNCPASRSSERAISETSHPVAGPSTYRPTRLLEIGEPEANRVRLRLSSELEGTSSEYATLSHCWGKSQTLRLTSHSIQRFRDGVAVSELGKTFQDAIYTAQAIGIKLLWIDSFCIFQDSKKDWQQEAGLMSQVYRNSILNIAASIAVDSDVGFLHERASTVEPYVVHTTWTNHSNGNYHVYHAGYWLKNFERMPLSQRAWAFQETTLAPRILYFCGTQMFWECHELKACETWPTGLPPDMIRHFSLKSTRSPEAIEIPGTKSIGRIGPPRVSADKKAPLHTASFRDVWSDIVEKYSLCSLTYPSDKLIALSGIAKYLEQFMDVEYCAGLWGHDMARGLAWFAKKSLDLKHVFPTETDPIPYRAPSWSWACIDGGIMWHDYNREECQCCVDVIRWQVQSATGDRTGAITGATVQLSGYLKTIELHPDFGNRRKYNIYRDGKWDRMGIDHFYFDRRPLSSQLHCMPLYTKWESLWALLLEPTRDVHGQFRRVGLFRTLFSDMGLVDLNEFRRFKNESWLEYELVDDEGKYTITII